LVTRGAGERPLSALWGLTVGDSQSTDPVFCPYCTAVWAAHRRARPVLHASSSVLDVTRGATASDDHNALGQFPAPGRGKDRLERNTRTSCYLWCSRQAPHNSRRSSLLPPFHPRCHQRARSV